MGLLKEMGAFSRVVWLATALCSVGSAQALVINGLPYNNSPDWTVFVGPGTSMVSGAGQTDLATANNTGVWFGNGTVYGDTPAWRVGDATSGNHLDLTASFNSSARDWSAYLYDRTHYAGIEFAPTYCDGNAGSCYGASPQAGVLVTHAEAGNPSQAAFTFVPVTLGQAHRYEFLLKDGLVSYKVDGNTVFSGPAYVSAPAAFIVADGLLVIGDGSGGTRTGTGGMTVHALAFDTAPTAVVPEPTALALWSLGLLGVSLQRRRAGRLARPR